MFAIFVIKRVNKLENFEEIIIHSIKSVISESVNVDRNYIVSTENGWDSLSIVRLLLMLEKKTTKRLRLDFFAKEKSIIEICKAISKHD